MLRSGTCLPIGVMTRIFSKSALFSLASFLSCTRTSNSSPPSRKRVTTLPSTLLDITRPTWAVDNPRSVMRSRSNCILNSGAASCTLISVLATPSTFSTRLTTSLARASATSRSCPKSSMAISPPPPKKASAPRSSKRTSRSGILSTWSRRSFCTCSRFRLRCVLDISRTITSP